MGKRSFRATAAGVEKLSQAFEKYGKTQDCLASFPSENSNRDKRNQITCSRQTVNKFLTGKPISKELFISLCNELNLNWQDIAELESEQDNNSWTVPSMNRPLSNIPITEGTGVVTLAEEPNNAKTFITFDTINGQVVITIPGDINSFLQNSEQQNIWLEAVKRSSGDKNATISKIEKGSIKITFNVSPDGIKKLEEEPNKIILVARIISRAKGEKLDLSDTDLSGVDLSGVDLSGINFSCADLRNANLENANLANADLDCADLSGANLRGANLNNTGFSDAIVEQAKFSNNSDISSEIKQNLIGQGAIFEDDLTVVQAHTSSKNPISFKLVFANLIRGNWSATFQLITKLNHSNLKGANLRGADLESADLRGADLESADLRGADLESAILIGAILRGAILRSANLRSANLGSADLGSADLISANLRSANLRSANLGSADLISANLRSADLRGADLESAILITANLKSANLENANLRSAILIGANLESAILIGANLESADSRSANLNGAILISANLLFAKLFRANLESAILESANLENANLFRANLENANLSRANLENANLLFANLSGANLLFANLESADLREAKVENARFGYNPGITENAKRDLKRRGAIFEDSPGDRAGVSAR
ncbi:pentapeptide repeat-containing protein [Anabaena catenula]|uniref:Pentapeptide repeat-containing protein n=1 Tax=Anabaena catenula FACHB-362 TaxID=2692877 RepID=A0ABR8JBI8_9NOST|nr:pentapeptide repeat-containing protein [Anabaena catenula]MBD2694835.1 pentapeptide repeat-containing protein [Anabaena catenula FACHB-362]